MGLANHRGRYSILFLALLAFYLGIGPCAHGQLRYPSRIEYRPQTTISQPLMGALGSSLLLMASGTVFIRELGISHANDLHRTLYGPDKTSWHGVDDWLQYLPAATYVGLTVCNMPGRSQWPERLTATLIAVGITAIVVNGIKACGISLRPDGSSWNSFPSGHTATAFLGAAMLWLEYGGQQPCLSTLGWYAAISTARLRMLHQRHWLGDTLAGAGIGIASAITGYLLAPTITDAFESWRRHPRKNTTGRNGLTMQIGLTPTCTSAGLGISLQLAMGV